MIGPRLVNLDNPVADHPLNRGLVGWWLALPHSMGGSRFFDIAGRNHGTLTNGPTWQPVSRPGGCGVVTCPKQGYVTAAGNELIRVSYAMWARWQLSGSTGYPYVLGTYELGSTGTTDRQIKFNSGDIAWSVYAGGVTRNAVYSTGANNDIWWHILGTADGSNVRLYVNGILRATTAAGDPYTGYTTPQIWFGSVSTGPAAVSVDDVRSYSRVLTDSEAYALYDQSCRSHPETLRRYTPRAWYFPAEASAPAAEAPRLLPLLGVGC